MKKNDIFKLLFENSLYYEKMSEILRIYADMFYETSEPRCSYNHCRNRKVPVFVDPVIMNNFVSSAPRTFHWYCVNGKWLPREEHASRTCAIHIQEWIDHVIAREIIASSQSEIDRNLYLYTSTNFYDIARIFYSRRTEIPRSKRPKTAIVPYEKMEVKYTKKHTSCVVCYEEKTIVALGCDHTICFTCLQKIKTTCPYCRTEWKTGDCKRVKDLFEFVEE